MNRTTFFKRTELSFRKFLLRFLHRVVHRKQPPLPEAFEFNRAKVLFIRQDRIGDVLVSTPLFSSLKSRYPEIVIDVLLSKNNFFVLDHEELVRKRWIYTKKLFPTLHILRSIRAERYDFVVDLMDNPSATSTVAMLLAGGRWNVGLEKENDFVYDIVVPMMSRKDTHIVERLVKLLEPFHVSASHQELHIRYSATAESDHFAGEVLKSPPRGGLTVGVNISAGSDARFWGVGNYRQLLLVLPQKDPKIRILLLSKPSDRERAQEIASGNDRVILAPQTTFDQFAALIKRLDMLITPDTSAVHLAAAFDIPSVILYVQSNRNLSIWEPLNTVSESIVTMVDDLTAISVDQVLAAYDRLQKRIPPAGAAVREKSHQGV